MDNQTGQVPIGIDHAGQPVFKRNRSEGYVIECNGNRAIIAASGGKSSTASEDYWAVGQLISVRVGEQRVVGMICDIDVPNQVWDSEGR